MFVLLLLHFFESLQTVDWITGLTFHLNIEKEKYRKERERVGKTRNTASRAHMIYCCNDLSFYKSSKLLLVVHLCMVALLVGPTT